MKTVLNHVALRFSQAAATYDAFADVQKKIALDLMAMISHRSDNPDILEIGCGTGILTRLLCKHFPMSIIQAVDISSKMIALHREVFWDEKRVRHEVGDVSSFKAARQFHLVMSNCALHWVSPIESAFKNLNALVIPEGILAASWMVKGTLRELRESRIRAVPHKRPQGALPETEECLGLLKQEGFFVKLHEEKEYVTHYPSTADLLRALNAMGVTGGAFSKAHSALTRKELQKLMEDYEAHYKNNESRVPATYRVLFVLAEKR